MHNTVHCIKSGRVHCAHTTCAVARTTPRSRACRAHNMRRSRAQLAQVARIAPRWWAQVATSFPRPSLGQVVTSFPGCDLKQVELGHDLKTGSRLRFSPNETTQVAITKRGRDTNFNRPGRDKKKNEVVTPMASFPLRCQK